MAGAGAGFVGRLLGQVQLQNIAVNLLHPEQGTGFLGGQGLRDKRLTNISIIPAQNKCTITS
jgi:hypothetical protein